MSPTITIGLPVYNAAPFLEDALRSVFAQTLTDWELIAVDDGSTDDSAGILLRLQDPRVRVLADGQRRGLGTRLNQIVSQAAGRYLGRMDADDLMHPERLARQLAFLKDNAKVDVVGCGLISFDAQGQPTGRRRLPSDHAQIAADPLSGFRLAHAATIARTDWWRGHPYNERNRGCEDWELWFSSRHDSRFANLPDLLYFYREEQAFSFAGYVRDKAELAALLWSKRGELGAIPAAAAAAGHWARIGVYALADVFGAEQKLVRRRGRPLTNSEAAAFRQACERIRRTTLPLAER